MPRMVENDPIKRLALRILDQFADRRLHVVRVTNEKHLRALKHTKVSREIPSRSIRLYKNMIWRLCNPFLEKKLLQIISLLRCLHTTTPSLESFILRIRTGKNFIRRNNYVAVVLAHRQKENEGLGEANAHFIKINNRKAQM